MTKQFKVGFLTALAGGVAWFAPAAKADDWDKLTILTFNQPVEIPGQVLPVGTYVFTLADASNRSIVQIFSEDQKHMVATIFAIPDYRAEPTNKTVVTFEERASGTPALHSWFYPGDTDASNFCIQNRNRSRPLNLGSKRLTQGLPRRCRRQPLSRT